MTTAENLVLLKYLYCLREMVAQDSAGRRTVVEQNSSTINSYTSCSAYATQSGLLLGSPSNTPGTVSNVTHRLAYATGASDGAGALAAVTLLAATASYKGRIKIIGIISTGAETPTFTFKDGDATACSAIGVVAHPQFTANVLMTSLKDGICVNLTANKSLVVSGASCGNAITYTFIYETWLEA